MKNPILELMNQKRNGYYCHAICPNNVQELETILTALCEEFMPTYSHSDILDFCSTFTVYCDNESGEECESVYNFDIENFITNFLDK